MTNCEENIRCLIPRVKPPIIKPPMYRSNFTEFIKRSHESNKECHRTMGYAKVKLNPPSEFLKKSRKKNVKPAISKKYCPSNIYINYTCIFQVRYLYEKLKYYKIYQ